MGGGGTSGHIHVAHLCTLWLCALQLFEILKYVASCGSIQSRLVLSKRQHTLVFPADLDIHVQIYLVFDEIFYLFTRRVIVAQRANSFTHRDLAAIMVLLSIHNKG